MDLDPSSQQGFFSSNKLKSPNVEFGFIQIYFFLFVTLCVLFTGDIGGQMGLFIGASILTILELFDYAYEVSSCTSFTHVASWQILTTYVSRKPLEFHINYGPGCWCICILTSNKQSGHLVWLRSQLPFLEKFSYLCFLVVFLRRAKVLNTRPSDNRNWY